MVIGIREFKSRLSEVLERAASGERVTITDRGIPKVVLQAAQPVDNIARGMAEGWITGGVAPGTPMPVPARRYRLKSGWTTERAISEDRGA